MTDVLPALGAFLVAPVVAVGMIRWSPGPLAVENWAGRKVPAVLGIALIGAVSTTYPLPFLLENPTQYPRLGLVAGFAAGTMFLAGLVDDIRASGARGLRGHLASLRRLRITTGIVKLLAGVGLGVWLSVLMGGSPSRVIASSVLIAVSTNLANAFDVRPGRTLKVTLPILLVSWLASPDRALAWLEAAGVGAGLSLLPLDLSERGMLGDAGSNPLGLLSGLGLAVILPTWGVVAAAALVLMLQVAAETVTISRLIEAVPPLRWFDRLGRRS